MAPAVIPPISDGMAEALGIDPTRISFDAPATVWSPRVPSLLFPAVQGARLMQFSVFRDRWKSFGQAAARRGISAVDAVRMARFGFVPEVETL